MDRTNSKPDDTIAVILNIVAAPPENSTKTEISFERGESIQLDGVLNEIQIRMNAIFINAQKAVDVSVDRNIVANVRYI
jgi:hypothetical protein